MADAPQQYVHSETFNKHDQIRSDTRTKAFENFTSLIALQDQPRKKETTS